MMDPSRARSQHHYEAQFPAPGSPARSLGQSGRAYRSCFLPAEEFADEFEGVHLGVAVVRAEKKIKQWIRISV